MSAIATAAPDPDEVVTDLYRRHAGDLYRWLLRRVGDHALAEDLAADVWVKAHRAVAGGGWRDDNPWAWLHMAARYRLADHWRVGFHARETPTDDAATVADRPDPDPLGAPEAATLRRIQARALASAIRRLPDGQRTCVWLRYFQERRWDDIAAELGLADATVRGRVGRATAALSHDPDLRRAVGAPTDVRRTSAGARWTDPDGLRAHYPAVAALTAEGRTSAAIGARLGLSQEQVQGIRKRVRREQEEQVAA